MIDKHKNDSKKGKKQSLGNLYKINIIKVADNMASKGDKRRSNNLFKSCINTKLNLNDAKNFLSHSFRTKTFIKKDVSEHSKKNLFSNVKKINFDILNKSQIIDRPTLLQKQRNYNYEKKKDDQYTNLVNLTNQLYENKIRLTKTFINNKVPKTLHLEMKSNYSSNYSQIDALKKLLKFKKEGSSIDLTPKNHMKEYNYNKKPSKTNRNKSEKIIGKKIRDYSGNNNGNFGKEVSSYNKIKDKQKEHGLLIFDNDSNTKKVKSYKKNTINKNKTREININNNNLKTTNTIIIGIPPCKH